MIVKILKDHVPVRQIPVEWPKDVDLKINFDVARKLGIQLIDELVGPAEQEGD
jgi:ABC-type uncharacterized transport system substrate-binding protein